MNLRSTLVVYAETWDVAMNKCISEALPDSRLATKDGAARESSTCGCVSDFKVWRTQHLYMAGKGW